MVIKRLTNLFLLRGRLFNLRLWFWEVFLSFLWWLLCCVMVDIPIFSSFFFSPIFILFFSIHFGVFIFFRLVRSLWEMKKDKKFLIVLQGTKGWSLSGLSSGSSLKFALSRVINFLISHNNTNSQSGSNVISEERKSSVKRIFIDWTTYSQRYFHNTCVTDSKESWFRYLKRKRTYPFQEPHGVVFAKTILKHLLSPSTKYLEYDYIMHDSNIGHYTH